MENKLVNKMKFSGSWYPDSAKDLLSELAQYARNISPQNYKSCGAILPHAGHYYSGRGISEFFVNANCDAKRVVIFAPSHYQYLPVDTLVGCRYDEFETPLGNIEGENSHFSSNLFEIDNHAVEMEHSVEMFLPFIKHYLPRTKLMVFLVPHISDADKLESLVLEFADAINYSPNEDIIIASSDFTHYGQRFGYTPYGSDFSHVLEKEVEFHDKKYADLLSEAKVREIYKNIEAEQPTICGIYPAMLAAKIMSNVGIVGDFVSYYNSNSISYPSADFVCYASILFHQRAN